MNCPSKLWILEHLWHFHPRDEIIQDHLNHFIPLSFISCPAPPDLLLEQGIGARHKSLCSPQPGQNPAGIISELHRSWNVTLLMSTGPLQKAALGAVLAWALLDAGVQQLQGLWRQLGHGQWGRRLFSALAMWSRNWHNVLFASCQWGPCSGFGVNCAKSSLVTKPDLTA